MDIDDFPFIKKHYTVIYVFLWGVLLPAIILLIMYLNKVHSISAKGTYYNTPPESSPDPKVYDLVGHGH